MPPHFQSIVETVSVGRGLSRALSTGSMAGSTFSTPRQEAMMSTRPRKLSIATTAAVLVAALASACGGNDDDASAAKGQGSLEVYAELQQAGIGGITQMPD